MATTKKLPIWAIEPEHVLCAVMCSTCDAVITDETVTRCERRANNAGWVYVASGLTSGDILCPRCKKRWTESGVI